MLRVHGVFDWLHNFCPLVREKPFNAAAERRCCEAGLKGLATGDAVAGDHVIDDTSRLERHPLAAPILRKGLSEKVA